MRILATLPACSLLCQSTIVLTEYILYTQNTHVLTEYILHMCVCVYSVSRSVFWHRSEHTGKGAYILRAHVFHFFTTVARTSLAPLPATSIHVPSLVDRHRHRHRHTDTQTHRHTDTQAHRHTDAQTLMQMCILSSLLPAPCTQAHVHACMHAYTPTCLHACVHAYIYACMHIHTPHTHQQHHARTPSPSILYNPPLPAPPPTLTSTRNPPL